jgi:hypothetical protein
MYKHLSQFVVKVADLAEAEGRELRKIVARMGMGFALALAGSAVLVVGLVLILASVWLGLHHGMDASPAVASMVTGVLALAVAGGAFYVVARLVK